MAGSDRIAIRSTLQPHPFLSPVLLPPKAFGQRIVGPEALVRRGRDDRNLFLFIKKITVYELHSSFLFPFSLSFGKKKKKWKRKKSARKWYFLYLAVRSDTKKQPKTISKVFGECFLCHCGTASPGGIHSANMFLPLRPSESQSLVRLLPPGREVWFNLVDA